MLPRSAPASIPPHLRVPAVPATLPSGERTPNPTWASRFRYQRRDLDLNVQCSEVSTAAQNIASASASLYLPSGSQKQRGPRWTRERASVASVRARTSARDCAVDAPPDANELRNHIGSSARSYA